MIISNVRWLGGKLVEYWAGVLTGADWSIVLVSGVTPECSSSVVTLTEAPRVTYQKSFEDDPPLRNGLGSIPPPTQIDLLRLGFPS